MNEWEVVGVIVVLVGLIGSIVAPIIKLNTTVTKLVTLVDTMTNNYTDLSNRNTESHSRIWGELGKQDEQLKDHEVRISVMEHKG